MGRRAGRQAQAGKQAGRQASRQTHVKPNWPSLCLRDAAPYHLLGPPVDVGVIPGGEREIIPEGLIDMCSS